uniref:MRG domain-containing protein n=1 Tax=Vombatus ursinus TaxID=29139 RepID=A0A4X2JQG7_VOMUR
MSGLKKADYLSIQKSVLRNRELFEASQAQSANGKMVGVASGSQQNTVENNVEVLSLWVQANRKDQNKVSVADSGSAGNRDDSDSESRDDSGSDISQQPHWRRALVNPAGEPWSSFMRSTDFNIDIHAKLKPWLVTEWDLVTRQKKLFCLPAKKNVESILEDYERYERSHANAEEQIYAVSELVATIRAYFNVMLGSRLLYKFEKLQYTTILVNDLGVPLTEIYGAPHLLRLFVKLGDMLSCVFFDSYSITLLSKYLCHFVKYLANNSAALFSASDYEFASPVYLQKVAEEPENVCHS